MNKYLMLKLIRFIFDAIMFIICIGFFIKKQIFLVYYVIFLYAAYKLFLYFESKKKDQVKLDIKILMMITIILDVVGGFYLNLYDTNHWFDKFMHFFGSFSLTLFYCGLIQLWTGIFSHSKMLMFIFLSSLGIASGAIYEIMEFVLDFIFKTNNQAGLIDTNLDLIFDIFGANLAAALSIYRKDCIY
ncbi:hypothetical protein QBE52_05750 [Clostridiaceae bacterium 35-E11]